MNDITGILAQDQAATHPQNPAIERNNIGLRIGSMSVIQENVSNNSVQISTIQNDIKNILQDIYTKQDALNLKEGVLKIERDICKIQRGLECSYGGDHFKNQVETDTN